MSRADRLERAALLSPMHPALKWQVNGALLAHRRAGDRATLCGRRGTLTVVVDAVPPCPKCFQRA